MRTDDKDLEEDELASFLVAFDSALREGASAAQLGTFLSQQHVDQDIGRLQAAKQCVELLNDLFGQAGDDLPSTRTAKPDGASDDRETFPALPDDHFEMIRKIGAGAMGGVYEVRDRERDTRFALKALHHVDPSGILRFKQEFRQLAGFVHKNLVVLDELFEYESAWFFTMELVEGVEFLTALGRRDPTPPPLDQRRLCQLLQQVVNGVGALHANGLLHRDLKPSNVLVTPDDRVVVIDFGLALRFQMESDGRPRLSEFAGTTAYMSPEQASCRPLSPKSDWYSLGVMLFQTLTGVLPFDGPTLLLAKQSLDAPRLADLLPEIDPRWSDLCERLLARRPEQRPDGEEIVQELHRMEQDIAPAYASRSRIGGSAGTSGLPSQAFVGRAEQLAQLHEAHRATLSGVPVVAAVCGDSGVGKTALVERFLEELENDAETVILRGRCLERESVSYKSLDSLVDALSRHLSQIPPADLQELLPPEAPLLARVFPVLMTVTPICQMPEPPEFLPGRAFSDLAAVRRRALEALRQLLTRLSDRAPLVLVIDDLQWGDEAGSTVLASLFHGLTTPMLVVVCYRTEQSAENRCLQSLRIGELPPLATQIGETSAFHRVIIDVPPLTRDESMRLAAQLRSERTFPAIPQTSPPLSEIEIAEESGGLPYFIVELANFSKYNGADALSKDDLHSAALPPHAGLDDVLWQRISRLPTAARTLVETVAVAGHPLQFNLACSISEAVPFDLRTFAEIQTSRLLRKTGPRWQDPITTFHDRIRECVVERLPAGRTCELHQRIASALEATEDAEAESLARHFDAAKQFGKARRYYELAAAAAEQVLAFERAIELYQRVLELTPPEESYPVRIKLGEVYGYAGRGGEAAANLEAAAELAPPGVAHSLRRAAARQYCISGRSDEGRVLLRQVLQACGIRLHRTPSVVLTALMLQRVRLWLRGRTFQLREEAEIDLAVLNEIDLMLESASGLAVQEPFAMASLHTRGLIRALDAGEPKRLVRALAWEAVLTATPGFQAQDKADNLLRMARSIVDRADDATSRGMLRLGEGGTAFLQVRMPEAVGPLSEAEQLFASEAPKAWWELTTARSLLAWADMHMGNFQSLRKRLAVYEQDAEDRGDLFLLSSIHGAGRPQTLLLDGQPEEADALVSDLVRRAPYKQFQQQHVSILYSQSHIDLYNGIGDRAYRRFEKVWSGLKSSMQLRNQFARVFMIDLRARSALLANKQKPDVRMVAAARRDLRRLLRESAPWVTPLCHRLSAALYESSGNSDAAIPELQAAVLGFQKIGFEICAAVASRRLGRLVGGDEGTQFLAAGDAFLTAQAAQNAEAIERVYYF